MIEVREEVLDGIPVRWHEAPGRTGGAPALWVHGVPNASEAWHPFLLAAGGIAPDLPGFGRSGKRHDFDYSIAGYDAWLERFCDWRGLDRVALVVHDWGAVALALAQRAPERVERLVVVNAVPLLPGYRWHRIARLWRTRGLGELAMGATGPLTARAALRGLVPREHAAAFRDEVLRHFDHGTQRAILRLYRSAPPEALAAAGARLGAIAAPALVLWGDRDPFIAPRFADGYAAALGDATVEHLPGAGHWPWLDAPEAVARVAGFLGAETSPSHR